MTGARCASQAATPSLILCQWESACERRDRMSRDRQDTILYPACTLSQLRDEDHAILFHVHGDYLCGD